MQRARLRARLRAGAPSVVEAEAPKNVVRLAPPSEPEAEPAPVRGVIATDDDEAPFDPPENLSDALGPFADDEEELTLVAQEPAPAPLVLAQPAPPPLLPEAPLELVVEAPPLTIEIPPEPEAPAFDVERAAKAGFFAVPPPGLAELEAEAETPPAPVRAYPPAPAINILACWERPESEAIFRQLAGDAKLRRANVQLSGGGFAAVAAALDAGSTPDLVLIDTTLGAAEVLNGLERTKPLLGADAKIIIVGAVNDIPLLRALAARGVSDYAVAPVSAEHLVGSICTLYADRDNARVIAVVGARGGVGASTLARNLAWSIAERQQQQATLVDLDPAFASGALKPDEASTAMSDVLPVTGELDIAALDAALVRRTPRLDILSAPAPLAKAFEPDLYGVDAVVSRLRRSSRFVVLDLPHAWNDWVKHTLAKADEIVLVTTPDLAALRNADHLLKAVRASKTETQPVLVLSMTGVPKRPEIAAREFAATLDLSPSATFVFDPATFGACEMAGEMLGAAAPKSKAALLVDALATALTGFEPVSEKAAPAAEARSEPVQAPPALPEAPQAASHGALLDRALAATAQDHPEAMQAARKPRRRLGFGRALAAMALLAAAAQMEVRAPVTHRATPLDLSFLARAPEAQPLTLAQAIARFDTGDAAVAMTTLRRAAEAGEAAAQYRLAKAYARGEGVSADAASAQRWTQRAAQAGHVRAMHDLGVYAASAHQEQTAFRWFRQAADFGLADSQYNLGVLYRDGRGVDANAEEALFWFMVAARQGDAVAQAHADALAQGLTAMQVERARLRAHAFRARQANTEANRFG